MNAHSFKTAFLPPVSGHALVALLVVWNLRFIAETDRAGFLWEAPGARLPPATIV